MTSGSSLEAYSAFVDFVVGILESQPPKHRYERTFTPIFPSRSEAPKENGSRRAKIRAKRRAARKARKITRRNAK